MTDKESIERISQAILSYDDWGRPGEFERCVIEIVDDKDVATFKKIWATALKFENWDNSDLTIGCEKTIESLKASYELDESVCRQLANAAAYQWK